MADPRPSPGDPTATAAADAPAASSVTGDATAGAVPSGSGSDTGFLSPPQARGELGRLAHYRVVRQLGAGGMGVVFEAEDTTLSRPVALKVMKGAASDSAAARERFVREAKAAAAVKHDHIVTIYQVGEDRGTLFIALEYLKGVPLDQYLARTPRPPLAVAVRVARQVADGLAGAHARGLVHRDIKPANVWLEAPKGRVKILDFGLARAAADDTHLTREGAVVGTPQYMAPEQARGAAVDHRTDLWSLGVLLYRMCTGEQPFKGATTMAVLTALAVDTPPPVREKNPAVPAELADLIHALLSRDPAGRPASAAVTSDLLRRVERDLAAKANAPSPGGPLPVVADVSQSVPQYVPEATGPAGTLILTPETGPAGPAKPRRRWLVAAGLLGVLAVVAAGVVITIRGKDGKETTVEVPDGSKVKVDPDGKVAVTLPPKVEPVAPAAAPAFFNGKDLAGWSGDPNVWRAENGEIVGTHPPGGAKVSYLALDRPVGDFELAYEVWNKRPASLVVGGGGLQVRTGRSAMDSGVIVQYASHKSVGSLVATGGRAPARKGDGTPVNRRAEVDGVTRPDDYNAVVVRVVGSRVTTTVNGVTAVDDEIELPPAGVLRWQLHNTTTELRVRNLRFTDLSPPSDPAFFNGKDLTGWVGRDGVWKVVDGAVVGRSSGHPTTALYTARTYADFELSFEANLAGLTASGLHFRSRATDPGGFTLTGPRCRLVAGGWGGVLTEGGGGPAVELAAPAVDAGKPGQFNAVTVRVVGKRVTTTVNGRQTVDRELDIPADGVIGWFLHLPKSAPADTAVLTIRNIQLIDLTKPAADPPFFNGRNLAGWAGDPKVWRVENGEIVGTKLASRPPEGGAIQCLLFDRPVGDFELAFEVRQTYPASVTVTGGGVVLRGEPKNSGRGIVVQYSKATTIGSVYAPPGTKPPRMADGRSVRRRPEVDRVVKADDYNAVVVRAVGNRVTTTVNGVVAVDEEFDLPPTGPLHWQLFNTADEVRIRNVRFTDLSPPAVKP